MGFCAKCGYSNHSTSRCAFKFFKPCIHCKEMHMSFLCPRQQELNATPNNTNAKNKKQAEKNLNKNSNSVNASVVWTEFSMQSNNGSRSILPTFTFDIAEFTVRGMKDSGSQQSFIEQSVAESLQLKVLTADVPITVNGFNGSQIYQSKIVEVPLHLGEQTNFISAYCVPDIRTKLELPNLSKLVSYFHRLGYAFADSLLNEHEDSISKINFILGTDDFNLLLEHQHTAGTTNPSLYSITDIGVMLYGDVDRWLTNCKGLPTLSPAVVLGHSQWLGVVVRCGERHPSMDE